jgi:hypothetical protein
MNDFAIFNRIIPDFIFNVPIITSGQFNHEESQEFISHTEFGGWLKQIKADEVFIQDITKFIGNKKYSNALIFVNTKVNQINCIHIYFILKKKDVNKIELSFFNIIEIANLFSKEFTQNLWHSISQPLIKQHNNIIKRNLETSYFALEPLFTLCYSNFIELGKCKYDFGELLFYFNHSYKWDRAGAGFKENSSRVVLQQLPKNRLNMTIPENITNQCLANNQLERNIFISI